MQTRLIASIAMVAAAIVVAALILSLVGGQKPLVVEDVLIDSGHESPFEAFSSFSGNSTFVVSPQMHETAEPVDHAMFNGTALFLQVMQGNGKSPVQVIRVYDEEENLDYCLTNFGDFNRSERMEAQECLEYISPENRAVVLLQFPDSELSMPRLDLSERKLVVQATSNDDIGKASFVALRIMFQNSQEIIDRSNTLLSGLQS